MDLNKLDSELIIGKNTVVKKALDMRTNPLDKDMEDYDFFSSFGEPNEKLKVIIPHLV